MGIKKNAYLRDMVRVATITEKDKTSAIWNNLTRSLAKKPPASTVKAPSNVSSIQAQALELWEGYIKPLIISKGNNVDNAVSAIMTDPKYKRLFEPPITQEKVYELLKLSRVYTYENPEELKIKDEEAQRVKDQIEKERAIREPIPRSASEEYYKSDSKKFFELLKKKFDDTLNNLSIGLNLDIIYSLKGSFDKQENIVDSIFKDPVTYKKLVSVIEDNLLPVSEKIKPIYDILTFKYLKDNYLRYYRNYKTIEDKIKQGGFETLSEYKMASDNINKVIIGYLNSLDQRT